MTDRAARLRLVEELDRRFGFCEDPAASLPVDRAATRRDGPLAGMLVGLKANIRVAGQAWTAGIGARRGAMASEDAAVVARLRAAGATLVSRLAMDEGALGAATDNPHFGRCENPAWPGHGAGGSSGGSAAAVAAGAVEAALGSDTLGSVRIPAAYCGVWGLKLGPEAAPIEGVFPLAPSLDALGIFGAGPRPIRAVLDVIAPTPEGGPITSWLAPNPAALGDCTPDTRAFVEQCAGHLAGLLGPPGPLPDLDLLAIRADAFLLTEVEAVQSLGSEPGLSDGPFRLIDYGRRVDADRLAETMSRLSDARRETRRALGTTGALLLPTVAAPAFAHGARPPTGQADFTALANVAGCPAIAIPRPGGGPPLSAQLVAPPGSERALLDLAETLATMIADA